MINSYNIGKRVISNIDFIDVPSGTIGYIIEDYGSGFTIAWDLPDKPFPYNFPIEEIKNMWAANPICPLKDGFDKETESQFLDNF